MGIRAAFEQAHAVCPLPALEEPIYMMLVVVEIQAMNHGHRKRYGLLGTLDNASLIDDLVHSGTWRDGSVPGL